MLNFGITIFFITIYIILEIHAYKNKKKYCFDYPNNLYSYF